jgi:Uri superfamily endonuclease
MIRATVTYQLWLWVDADITLTVGALGRCTFPTGWYAYTGSARRGMAARLRRHSDPQSTKRLRWHVDYLLASGHAAVRYLALYAAPECAINGATGGTVPCPGFGASDCRSRCGSHLRHLGPDFDLQALTTYSAPGL